MNMILWNTFEALVNLYQGVMIFYFTFSLLTENNEKVFWKSPGIVCGIVLAIAITIVNAITVFEHFIFMAYIVFVFLYALVFLDGTLLKKIFASLFPFAIIAVITSFFINFFAVLSNTPLTELLSSPGLSKFALLITVQIFIAYFLMTTLSTLKNKCDLGKSEWFLIFTIFFISIIIATLLSLIALDDITDRDRTFIVLSIAGLSAMNLVTYYLVVNLSVKNNAVKENELLKIQQAHERQYINNAKLEYETIMELKHDFKDNYAVIYSLLSDNKTESALRHIEQNAAAINAINAYIETDNDIVNAIINLKTATARALGIQVSCISVSDFSGISSMDLCDLLSNMLENAITACVNIENENIEKQIHLKISSNDLRYIFSVKNTIMNSVLSDNPSLKTIKNNKKEHGQGIKIIRAISAKYDGQCDFYEEDNYFCCTVTLRKT